MEVGGGPVIQLKLVIRKLDDSHLAVAVTMVPDSASADNRKMIDAQFAAVKIVTR